MRLLMEQGSTNYRLVIVHDTDEVVGFTPHKILVDAATLEQSFSVLWNDAKVILIDTGLTEDEMIRLLFHYRLDGVISVDTSVELFWKALETIRSGQVWLDHGKIKAILYNLSSEGISTAQVSYSKRERDIVLLVAEGQTNREIASQLNISEQTTKTHISRIFSKAGVTSRTQLAPLALRFKMETSVNRHAKMTHL